MKRFGLFMLISVWLVCITALIIAGQKDAAEVFTVGGIFGLIVLAAALA